MSWCNKYSYHTIKKENHRTGQWAVTHVIYKGRCHYVKSCFDKVQLLWWLRLVSPLEGRLQHEDREQNCQGYVEAMIRRLTRTLSISLKALFCKHLTIQMIAFVSFLIYKAQESFKVEGWWMIWMQE